MSDSVRYAPGWPGIPPRWTSSAKTGVGTALNQHSKVWFTLSHGILNEVYFPRVDQACTRDLGFLVTDGRSFFSEEKRHCTFENRPFEPGVPAFELTNTEIGGRYRIHKEVFTDPYRNVLLQKIRFEAAAGAALRLSSLCVALAPPGQLRLPQHRLGRRLQRAALVLRGERRNRFGPRQLSPLEKNVGRIRGRVRRMAGHLDSFPDGVGVRTRRKWEPGLYRRN